MRSLEEKKRWYARTVLRAAGLGSRRSRRPVYIFANLDPETCDFVRILSREAYAMGSSLVDALYQDPELIAAQCEFPLKRGSVVPGYFAARAREVISSKAIWILLVNRAELGSKLYGLPLRRRFRRQAAFMNRLGDLAKAIDENELPSTICAIPSEPWARALGVSVNDLWEELFAVSGIEEDADPVRTTGKDLDRRCLMLNELGIDALRFTGCGTDFSMRLCSASMWVSGHFVTNDGTWFFRNWRPREVYTTPDWRTVEGRVAVTVPVSAGGTKVEKLNIVFERGFVAGFEARSGASALRGLLQRDPTMLHVGEIALVDIRDNRGRFQVPYLHPLLDENRRSHFALGMAYVSAIRNGSALSKQALRRMGCNIGGVMHIDFPFSDETTRVTAVTRSGRPVLLMEKGCWVSPFF